MKSLFLAPALLLTTLFGQSGLGKTSLLRAGIVPRLRAEGYCPIYVRIDYAPDSPPPSEQIKQASRSGADAIVLDLKLPGMSGLDLCRAVRTRWGKLPVLFLTANAGTRTPPSPCSGSISRTAITSPL